MLLKIAATAVSIQAITALMPVRLMLLKIAATAVTPSSNSDNANEIRLMLLKIAATAVTSRR